MFKGLECWVAGHPLRTVAFAYSLAFIVSCGLIFAAAS